MASREDSEEADVKMMEGDGQDQNAVVRQSNQDHLLDQDHEDPVSHHHEVEQIHPEEVSSANNLVIRAVVWTKSLSPQMVSGV